MFPRSFFPRSAFPAGAYPPGGAGAIVAWAGQFRDVPQVDVSLWDTDLHLRWSWTPPPTTFPIIYQVYLNHQLRWAGAATEITLPLGQPPGTSLVLHVGAVAAANRDVSYTATLPLAPGGGNRAYLEWYGGRWLDTDLTGFRIFRSAQAGQAPDMTRPVATLPAAVGGGWGDGYGRGPYGRAPYGRAAVTYRWTSPALQPGVWQFAVVSFDGADNLSADPPVVTVTIAGPPPAVPTVGGRNLWIELVDGTTGVARLAWNPSA